MGDGGSKDSGYDDADDIDVKRKVGCGDEADDDSDVNDNGGVDIDNANGANDGDGMRKTERDDDTDCSGVNGSDDRDVDGNGVFDTKVVMRLTIVTTKLAGDLAECNGSSKMERRVVVMSLHIFKNEQ